MSRILIKNIQELWLTGDDFPQSLTGKDLKELPSITNAYVAKEDGVIIDYGSMSDWQGLLDWRGVEVIDAEGCMVLPAFCDSHTHLVFAETRESEFVDRINGLSYEEIAAKGGGILNSAQKLADKNEDELFENAWERLQQAMSFGTGAIEIKSGYGLSLEAELKMLRVIKKLKENAPIAIKATFLGAHAIPTRHKNNPEDYIQEIIGEMLPAIQAEQLADYIDVFCERNYFTVNQMQRVVEAGAKAGLKAKLHVNQFSSLGAVPEAVRLNALSVDHLEVLSDQDLLALRGGNTIPVLLPGCSHFLSIPYGPARELIDAQLPLALASDFNPGSAPCLNMQVILSLACVKMKMTPEEALAAITLNGANAMELSSTHGSISRGKTSPLILTKPLKNLSLWPYSFGENFVDRLII